MNTYKVTSGSMRSVKVRANTIRQAVDKAIKLKKPKYIGYLAEVIDNKGVVWYIDPIRK